MEKEIFYIGCRSFQRKADNQKYFVVDYTVLGKDIPKTDFISALEFTEISNKMKNKNYTKCFGIFDVNSYDKLYLSSIK